VQRQPRERAECDGVCSAVGQALGHDGQHIVQEVEQGARRRAVVNDPLSHGRVDRQREDEEPAAHDPVRVVGQSAEQLDVLVVEHVADIADHHVDTPLEHAALVLALFHEHREHRINRLILTHATLYQIL